MAINTVNSKGITDATITEDDIAISNAPADGKFLQYKDSSDKLTWADVPAGVGGATGVNFNDSVNVVWGTGADLYVYHDATNSYIRNATGDLKIGNYISSAFEDGIVVKLDGAVEAYHNNVKKLETSATGVTVTGTVAATAYTGDGSALTGLQAGATGGNSGANGVFWENEQTVTHDYTITNNYNAGTWGPVTINSGVTVTVGDGEYWTIM